MEVSLKRVGPEPFTVYALQGEEVESGSQWHKVCQESSVGTFTSLSAPVMVLSRSGWSTMKYDLLHFDGRTGWSIGMHSQLSTFAISVCKASSLRSDHPPATGKCLRCGSTMHAVAQCTLKFARGCYIFTTPIIRGNRLCNRSDWCRVLEVDPEPTVVWHKIVDAKANFFPANFND
eukprot:5401144-Amphidinium_carterae.2